MRHPLLTESARAAVAERPGERVEVVLRDLVLVDEFVDDVHTIRVDWASREVDPAASPVREPSRPSVFLDPEIE